MEEAAEPKGDFLGLMDVNWELVPVATMARSTLASKGSWEIGSMVNRGLCRCGLLPTPITWTPGRRSPCHVVPGVLIRPGSTVAAAPVQVMCHES